MLITYIYEKNIYNPLVVLEPIVRVTDRITITKGSPDT